MQNFDTIVQASLELAQAKALEQKNSELQPTHLLYGLVKNPKSYCSKFLKDKVKDIEAQLEKFPTVSNVSGVDQIRTSGQLGTWLTQASANATSVGREEFSERDLVKFFPQFFPWLDIDYSQMKDSEDEHQEVPDFLINLNERAESGNLDPVIGRTKEIRAVMEILGRRSKNNPILVGPPGVGKTAIVEGLAEAIVAGNVPDVLKGKTVYSLELGSLISGTKYRGDFEKRVENLLKFAKQGAGQFLIFIDEIHQLIGAGKTDGAMDAANLLKPALARGELHCIGATTDAEFHKYILNDAALERRFRKVPVLEPTKEDSIEIIMGLKEKFEAHHGIKISDAAIYNSVYLSDQYITDKNLPDKAIDLIDESASALKLSAEAMPAELEILKSQIRNKKILAQVDTNSGLEDEVKEMQEEFDKRFQVWEAEVGALKKVSEMKNQLEKLKFDLQVAEREQNYAEASRIKYSLIPEIEKQMGEYSHDWELRKEDIALVISRQTGIPVAKILKSKQENLLKLEKNILKSVYGQDAAIHEISETLLAGYAGLGDPSRPLGSFLLLGPSGVGKTETAKTLARELFDSEENMIRIDMSEFSERHAVAKLIGSPAGYIGHEDGGVLTEAVRKKPYAVILFDEIEKAHPDFSDILLQILDDGRLSDNKGRLINFKNTIIFLTSNAKDYKNQFKPEVLGRLDNILEFKLLGPEIMEKLVHRQIEILNTRLDNQNVEVSFDDEVVKKLSELGYDQAYGARPLASVFKKFVIRPLSHVILKGEDELDQKSFKFVVKDGEITLV